jgi:hypothetical protein
MGGSAGYRWLWDNHPKIAFALQLPMTLVFAFVTVYVWVHRAEQGWTLVLIFTALFVGIVISLVLATIGAQRSGWTGDGRPPTGSWY